MLRDLANKIEEVGNIKLPLLINVDKNNVEVLTTLDRYNTRYTLFDCSPTVPIKIGILGVE